MFPRFWSVWCNQSCYFLLQRTWFHQETGSRKKENRRFGKGSCCGSSRPASAGEWCAKAMKIIGWFCLVLGEECWVRVLEKDFFFSLRLEIWRLRCSGCWSKMGLKWTTTTTSLRGERLLEKSLRETPWRTWMSSRCLVQMAWVKVCLTLV